MCSADKRLTQNGIQYVLDLNSGLTQVLNDGTSSYLYGNGRISQTGSVTEYFLGDALGSVRQLTDVSGEITLAMNYDPYGTVTLSSGNGTSPFAYTGEQLDASGLTYLRARYYSSADGRFLSRDTWGGDVNRPLSLNRWIYVEGNPVNLVDPSGNIPTQDDVKHGRAIYSCKCGWIDTAHASTENALRLFRILAQENKQFNNAPPEYRTDLFVASPIYNEVAAVSENNRTMNAVIKSGLGLFTKKAVALSVYRTIHEKIENAQGWYSSYSFEDLASDEIGFYLALKFNLNDNLNVTKNQSISVSDNPEAWNWLAEKCGFAKARQTAIQNSKDVYGNMGGFWKLLRDTPHVYEWGSPKFFMSCETANMCGNISRSWPSEFRIIPPLPGNRKSLWWEYDSSIDGPRFESPFTGFFFLRKDN